MDYASKGMQGTGNLTTTANVETQLTNTAFNKISRRESNASHSAHPVSCLHERMSLSDQDVGRSNTKILDDAEAKYTWKPELTVALD